MKRTIAFAFLAVALVVPGAALASSEPMVGGQAMYRSKDIVDNAVNSADHTTLVAAVKAAGLVGTLKSKGPFTVFAPTNAAFAGLPAGTVEMLLKPENRSALSRRGVIRTRRALSRTRASIFPEAPGGIPISARGSSPSPWRPRRRRDGTR